MPTPVIPQIKSLDILRKQLNAAFASISGGSGVTSITAGSGLSGGVITTTGTIALTDTTVAAGSYTASNITVDAKGRITAAASGIAQTEVDFGTTPLAEGTFTITDAGVSASSQIMASLAWQAPTGKDLDEVEMDELYIICQPGTGDFQMRVKAIDGSYLADKFKINYVVG